LPSFTRPAIGGAEGARPAGPDFAIYHNPEFICLIVAAELMRNYC